MGASNVNPTSGLAPGFLGISPEDRHHLVAYPNEISKLSLREIAGKQVADLGVSDDDVELGQWIEGEGGIYIPINNDPFRVGMVDVVHARFVLWHLPMHERKQAILNALSIAKEKVVFMEWDWRCAEGSVALQRFARQARLQQLGFVDHEMGAHLAEDIRFVSKMPGWVVQEPVVHSRKSGTQHYPELRATAAVAYNKAHRMTAMKQVTRSGVDIAYKFIHYFIAEEAKKEHPEPYRPPDIVVVEVVKEMREVSLSK